jgi:hypothetical protein
MTRPTAAGIALTLFVLVSASCGENTAPAPPEAREPLATAPVLAAASNRWVTRADMPSTERSGLDGAVVTNAAGQSIFYAIGGRSLTGGSLSKVQAYNAASNTWSFKASLPVPLYGTNGTGVIGGKIYISGGLRSPRWYQSELYRYDPATNTWAERREMPNSGSGGVTGVIRDKLYVLTSCNDEDNCYPASGNAFFYRYDPATDEWAVLPTPPSAGRGAAGVIGGRFYVAGDRGQLLVYDPVINRWATRAPTPEALNGPAVTLRAKLYVLGSDSTRVYDPATDAWTSTAPPMPARSGAVAVGKVLVNGQPRIEVVGGRRPGNNLAYLP